MDAQRRQESVTAALSQIVGDFGRKVSDDPVRLRNLLVDATGVDAMVLDAEINAVVSAVETESHTTVLADDTTAQAEATERLAAKLPPEQAELAGWATVTWSTMFGGDATSRPGVALGAAAASAATVLPSGDITDDATVLPGQTDRMSDSSSEPAVAGDDSKRGNLLLAGFGALLLLVVGVIFATTRGGDDANSFESGSVPSVTDASSDTGRDTPTTPTTPRTVQSNPQVPVVTVTTPPVTTPPVTTPPVTAPPVTAPPVTAAPVNQAPVVACENFDVVFAGFFAQYLFGVPEGCFSDPDDADLVIFSDIGLGAPGCDEGFVCWLYDVPPGWDGAPFEVVATIWAADPDGLQSGRMTLTMCLNC